MLSRYSRVDPDTSEYHKPENAAVVYGSMTHVRIFSGYRMCYLLIDKCCRPANEL